MLQKYKINDKKLLHHMVNCGSMTEDKKKKMINYLKKKYFLM